MAVDRLSILRVAEYVGVNIGANKDSPDRIADYVTGITAMSPLADYLPVNISSPTTPDCRPQREASSSNCFRRSATRVG